MKRSALITLASLVVGASVLIPTAVANAAEPEYCSLATPAVRDVVQAAPAIAAVLNLDPALPDDTIKANRANIGCGPIPDQTEAQARTAVCDVLVEAKVDALVKETNNPQITTLLDTVRPALPEILAQARVQLKCDNAVSEPEAPQVEDVPEGSVETGWDG